jgi:hypothetical protein
VKDKEIDGKKMDAFLKIAEQGKGSVILGRSLKT